MCANSHSLKTLMIASERNISSGSPTCQRQPLLGHCRICSVSRLGFRVKRQAHGNAIPSSLMLWCERFCGPVLSFRARLTVTPASQHSSQVTYPKFSLTVWKTRNLATPRLHDGVQMRESVGCLKTEAGTGRVILPRGLAWPGIVQPSSTQSGTAPLNSEPSHFHNPTAHAPSCMPIR
ncbi:unnamed protein product [Protopolystoma xenopodis]|uniref:Uncharacterized protein n=1 Tax=Protopolystoma xenopodis TaxID=117903 RepID=A0A3S5ALA8_9PLAT|nr:unnamed protein product [Protopolystoma xenopodis]